MKQEQITRHIIDTNMNSRIGAIESKIRKRIVHKLHILWTNDAEIEARSSMNTHIREDIALKTQARSELLQVDLELSSLVKHETGKAERAEVYERDLFGEEDGARRPEELEVGERVAVEHELLDELQVEVESSARFELHRSQWELFELNQVSRFDVDD